MSDNEIIKALEICAKDDCKSCPLSDYDGCKSLLFDGDMVLTLINRQKVEIERLISAVDNSTQEFLKLQDEYQEQKAEIEALINGQETLQKYIAEQNSEISILKDSNINLQDLYYTEREKVAKAKQKVINTCKMLKTAKTEAIKEFAERLKEKLRRNAHVSPFAHNLNDVIIDNLVKEMVGEQE